MTSAELEGPRQPTMVTDLVDRVAALRLTKLKPRRGNVRLLCLVMFYLVFLVVGAAIFSAIEAPVEVGLIRSTRRMKQKFLQANPCVTGEIPLSEVPRQSVCHPG